MLCAVRVESDVDRSCVKVGLKIYFLPLPSPFHYLVQYKREVREGNTKGLVHGGREIFYGSGEKRLQRADIRGPEE